MSFIPNYIIKRMFPKDCAKVVPNGIEITFINVISPLSIDEIPDNVLDYVDLTLDNAIQSNEFKSKIIITVENKEYTAANAKEFQGQTIPVGGAVKIFVPITTIKAGEEHEVKLQIKLDNPIELIIKRTVC
jgi:hypothetical protein